MKQLGDTAVLGEVWCDGPECVQTVAFVRIAIWKRSNFVPANRAVVELLECPRCGDRTWRYR